MAQVSLLALRSLLSSCEVCDLVGPDHGITPTMKIKLKFYDATAFIGVADIEGCVTLQADLHDLRGAFLLTRQGSGLASRLAQLQEQKLGVGALDDAFIVRCDDDGFSVLRRCEGALLAMLPSVDGCRVELMPSAVKKDADSNDVAISRLTTAKLYITWPVERVTQTLHLWERLYAMAIGA
jgi:hypothetical protein